MTSVAQQCEARFPNSYCLAQRAANLGEWFPREISFYEKIEKQRAIRRRAVQNGEAHQWNSENWIIPLNREKYGGYPASAGSVESDFA
jgi:hypothetical protein